MARRSASSPPASCAPTRGPGPWRVEHLAVGALAARRGPPLGALPARQLRANARAWSTALAAAWPHGPTLVMPSVKANYALALRRLLSAEGLGCDAFGGAEL